MNVCWNPVAFLKHVSRAPGLQTAVLERNVDSLKMLTLVKNCLHV